MQDLIILRKWTMHCWPMPSDQMQTRIRMQEKSMRSSAKVMRCASLRSRLRLLEGSMFISPRTANKIPGQESSMQLPKFRLNDLPKHLSHYGPKSKFLRSDLNWLANRLWIWVSGMQGHASAILLDNKMRINSVVRSAPNPPMRSRQSLPSRVLMCGPKCMDRCAGPKCYPGTRCVQGKCEPEIDVDPVPVEDKYSMTTCLIGTYCVNGTCVPLYPVKPEPFNLCAAVTCLASYVCIDGKFVGW